MSEHNKTVEVSPAPMRASATPPEIHLDRLLDGLRVTVIGVVATVGLSVGFGVGEGWTGVAAGFASVFGLVAVFKVPPVRNRTACLADWIISRG